VPPPESVKIPRMVKHGPVSGIADLAFPSIRTSDL
jgi:hypothetical protein